MTTKILCVDDDVNILQAYQRNLRKQFSIDTAIGGQPALSMIASQGPYAVIVADMQMPGMNGVEFLSQARQKAPDTVRIMLTGNADQKTAAEAVNKGQIYQFLTKPCPHETLAQALENGIRQYRLVTAERELLEKTLNGSIRMLTEVLSSVEPVSFGRGEVLREYMRSFAESLHISETWHLELAAMLSQIGYVTLPPAVVKKAREGSDLAGNEKDLLIRVPEIGATLLANIPRLEPASNIVRYQNKNYDGSGFPADNVSGDDIPVGARILKVLCDLVQLEAQGISRAKALEQMQSRTGSYDPRVLDTAFVCFDIYLETSTSSKAATESVSVADLRVGQVVASKVETKDGALILRAGLKLSQLMLEKLRNFHQLSGIKEPISVEA